MSYTQWGVLSNGICWLVYDVQVRFLQLHQEEASFLSITDCCNRADTLDFIKAPEGGGANCDVTLTGRDSTSQTHTSNEHNKPCIKLCHILL